MKECNNGISAVSKMIITKNVLYGLCGAAVSVGVAMGFFGSSQTKPKSLNPLERALLDFVAIRDKQAAEVGDIAQQISQLQHDLDGTIDEICRSATAGKLTAEQLTESKRIMGSNAEFQGLGFDIERRLAEINQLLRTYPNLSEASPPTVDVVNSVQVERINHHARVLESYEAVLHQLNDGIEQLRQCNELSLSSFSLR